MSTAIDTPPETAFTLSRSVDAPLERVFAAWTEGDQLARWFGPKGLTMLSCTLDLRPGGLFHYGMSTSDGQEMWGRWVFVEVVRPERLEFVLSFSDAGGGANRSAWAPGWPLEMLSVVTFSETDGRTTVTLTSVPKEASEEECRIFEEGFESMRMGWGATLDQLDEFLAGIR